MATPMDIGAHKHPQNHPSRSSAIPGSMIFVPQDSIFSARLVGELCAPSVSDNCLRWRAGGTGVALWPNPAFLPKVLDWQPINQVLEVNQFQPSSA